MDHILQLLKICRTKDRDAGYSPQIGNIKQSMMGFPVASNKTAAVNTEHHMKILQCNIMQKHVIASLEKAGINTEYGYKSLFCHTSSHGYRTTLRDSYIEESAGKLS